MTETMTLPLAAKRLGVSYVQAMRLILIGDLPAEKIDGRWQVDREIVERVAAEGKSAQERASEPVRPR